MEHRNIAATGALTGIGRATAKLPRQIVAAAMAVGVPVFALELLGSHDAPAAATTLLVSTGLAKPGAPLMGVVIGLAIVVVFGPLCGRWCFAREEAAREQVVTSANGIR